MRSNHRYGTGTGGRWSGGRRAVTALAAAAALALAVGGCSDSSNDSSQSSAAEADPVAQTTSPGASPSPTATNSPGAGIVGTRSSSLGTILVDDQGHTLYLFEKDRTGTSTCTGACAAAWPPLLVTDQPQAESGSQVRSDLLGTTTRSDGRKQVTYNKHPLYRFSGDHNPGETNGQGLNAFGAKWFVLDHNGNAVTHTATGSPSPTESPSESPTESPSPTGTVTTGGSDGY